MTTYIIDQDYNSYSKEDHKTWRILCERQSKLPIEKISKQYLEGFYKLDIDKTKVAQINEISKRLEALSGWTLVPVTGLLPTRDFFFMIINKRYPITVSVRKPVEIDFSEQPDIFHDICGHLPLLTNEKFIKFLTAFSIIAIKYVNHDRAVDYLGRLYWFTYEMGIILEKGEYKPYGGAVITSAEEIENVQNPNIPKHPFEIDHIFRTAFSPFSLQREYFVINSFDNLFNSLENLESKLIEHLLIPHEDFVLHNYSINFFDEDCCNVPGLLKELQYNFPTAISFVEKPMDDALFIIEDQQKKINIFVDYHMQKVKSITNEKNKSIKINDNVNEIVSKYLNKDENILLNKEDILITESVQESFNILLSTLCNKENDVILAEDPSYIGSKSFLYACKHKLEGIQADEDGIDLIAVKNKLFELQNKGKKVKLLYVTSGYQDPFGSCMPIGSRLKLLELARKYNFLIIEDAMNNFFDYTKEKNPTLKSLDKFNRVIYIGSFSKQPFLGLKLGLIAANQKIENETGQIVSLIDELLKVKMQLAGPTSSISQSILGGTLLDLNYTLTEWSKPQIENIKEKKNRIEIALNKYIKPFQNNWAKGIRWTIPEGGFVVKITLPFTVNMASIIESANEYNVIFYPMRYLYVNNGGENEIQLSFSNLSADQIENGVLHLISFFKSKITKINSKEVKILDRQENY